MLDIHRANLLLCNLFDLFLLLVGVADAVLSFRNQATDLSANIRVCFADVLDQILNMYSRVDLNKKYD